MDRLAIPWLFMGPSGSGKLSQARAWIEAAHKTKLTLPLESRTFVVGDGYEARVLTSPYHFEIDIPNLSMQDKQIIGELLTTFFVSGDVFHGLRDSSRKLVILRRAHHLSQQAAIRVRAILQQYVMPPDAGGMIWMTAREMTGSLSILEDLFVRQTVPRMPYAVWSTLPIPAPLLTHEAYMACEGRQERAAEIVKFFPDGVVPEWPRRIQDFYDEMIRQIIDLAQKSAPVTLDVVLWIRTCVYQALSFCQTAPDIVDSCAAAIQRNADRIHPAVFFKIMAALKHIEPHTSYRTPLSLEAAILTLFEVLRTNKSLAPSNGSTGTRVEPAAVLCPEPAAEAVAAGLKTPDASGTKKPTKRTKAKPVGRGSNTVVYE
jgi:hypothetical protein